MMNSNLLHLVARGDDHELQYTPTMIALVITLLVLAIVALLAVMTLYFLRLRRRSMKEQLPVYDEKRSSSSSSIANHRRVAVRPSESIIVYQEKQSLIANSEAPSSSPVPEIRVGEHSIGLEPLSDDKLPAYQKDESDRFQSLDLERIGGLREKELEARFS